MIDKKAFQEISDKVSDLDKKNYEISALADFLAHLEGEVTIRVNGQYTFTVPASLLQDHFSAKKETLETEASDLEDEIKKKVPGLAVKGKAP